MDYLKHHYLFAPLDQTTLMELLKRCHRHNFSAGSLIFSKSEPATEFYFILKGSVRLYFAAPNGKEKTLKTFHAGESFGEALMFMQSDAYPANAMCTEDSELLAINNCAFRESLLKNPNLCLAIMGHLSEHVQTLSRQIEMLSVFDARARLLHYLAGKLSGKRENGVTYPFNMSKKQLAEFLAIRPETLSRLLKQLEQDHIISWGQDGITVCDWQKLMLTDR